MTDAFPCGLLTLDAAGRIMRANSTFGSWIGLQFAEMEGRRFSDLLPIAGRVFYETNLVPVLRLRQRFEEVALDLVHADRSRVSTLVNAVEERDADGAVVSVRMVIVRTGSRVQFERSLIDARNVAEEAIRSERETSELREQFIAVLGHDLRNPLASISSGMRLLGKEELSERGRRVVDLIDGSVVRAAGLIDNVLDFARGRLGGGLTLSRDASEPIEPVLRQVVSELRSIAPDRVIVEEYGLGDPVDCDRVRVGQLLSNLLGNALTHGSKDGPVVVTAMTHAGLFELSVANGGSPIPPDAMKRLFQPFFRGAVGSHREGLGLGLHIASEIARAHGGRLDVASDASETKFTFVMPLLPGADTEDGAGAP